MKLEKKNQAIEMRKCGKSINEIYKSLSVSKGSVSVWVRDVQLTDEQKSKLTKPQKNDYNYRKFLKIREEYQNKGKIKASEKDIEHAIGCMLYWAEGDKKRNTVSFTNSDINVHKTFLSFLKKYFNISNDRIAIRINCYLDHEISLEEICHYWIQNLGINGCKVNKAVIRDPMKSSYTNGSKKSKLKYGTMSLTVCSSEIVQHIYGAIQVYGGFTNKKWVS